MSFKQIHFLNSNVVGVLIGVIAILVIYLNFPLERTPIVQLGSGKVRGIVQNVGFLNREKVYFYQGIRYGNASRFEKPKPVNSWSGVYEADSFRDACPQFGSFAVFQLPFTSATQTESEDCLYLNVWQPTVSYSNNQKLLPVMVWIHGGAFQIGTIFTTVFDGKYIAQQGNVVLVSVNYRLGPLGFMYAGKNLVPGNLGLHDQILALKWVQENIHNFGGDPTQVTIFGESAGSMSVGALILSPLTKSLFHRAIMQSGAPIAPLFIQPKNKLIKLTKIFAQKLDCPIGKMTDTIDCLRNNRTVEQMKKVWFDGFIRNEYFPLVFGDEVLPVNPIEALRDGQLLPNKKVDLMYGVTRDEGTTFVERISQEFELKGFTIETARLEMIQLMEYYGYSHDYSTEVADFYIKKLKKNPTQNDLKSTISHVWGDFHLVCPTILFAEKYAQLANSTNRHFSYRLMQPALVLGIFGKPNWMGVTHGQDLFYLFLRNFAWFCSTSHYQLSLDMIGAWANFAKNGHPGKMGEVEWEAIMKNNPRTKHMHLHGFNYKMVDGYYEETCNQFWRTKILI